MPIQWANTTLQQVLCMPKYTDLSLLKELSQLNAQDSA